MVVDADSDLSVSGTILSVEARARDKYLQVRIYESFGFKVKGRTVLASSVKGESYPLFALKKILECHPDLAIDNIINNQCTHPHSTQFQDE